MEYTVTKSPLKTTKRNPNNTDMKLFDKFIPIPNFFYLLLDFTPYSNESKWIKFIFWLNFFNNCAAVIGQIIFLRNVIEANASFIESTALFGCICFGSDNNVKLIMTIWLKKSILKKMYEEFLKLYPKTIEKQNNYNFKNFEFYWKFASRIYYFLMIFHNLFFCIFPFAHSAFNYYTEDVFLYRTPLFVWYPFDIRKNFLLYCIIYIHQAYCVMATTLTTLGFALLFCNIVLQTGIHYDYIANELKQTNMELIRRRMDDVKSNSDLRKLLITHQTVFELCDLINDAFGFSLFYYFLNVTISICCLGIQVAGGASIFILFNYFPFFAFQVIQLFVFCALGEKIVQVSENICEAAYSARWIDASSSYKRSILILMNRSQKPSEIKGGGFFLLSFETFRRVMSFSYQVFALLIKMLKN